MAGFRVEHAVPTYQNPSTNTEDFPHAAHTPAPHLKNPVIGSAYSEEMGSITPATVGKEIWAIGFFGPMRWGSR